MKFTLVEGFGYTQSALNASEKASEALDNFIVDVELIEHGNDFLSEEDVNKLIEAKRTLDRFYKDYSQFAKKQATAFYERG